MQKFNISLFFLLYIVQLFSENVYLPNITSDNTGQYVYAIWSKYTNNGRVIQVMKSSDYGVTFENPSITTGDGGIPDLSNESKRANSAVISTNSTGQYVFAIWERTDGFNYIIQTANSSDYGNTWANPNISTGNGGSPNF
jgi:hypothetical protein